jgi:hypothetical protein
MQHQKTKKRQSKKHKKKANTIQSKEPYGYQKDNPLTLYYAKYIEASKS